MTSTIAAALPEFSSTDAPEAVVAGLRGVGGVIIHGLVDPSIVSGVERELGKFLDAVPFCEGFFMGRRTKRTSRIIAKSPSSHELVAHPMILEVVERLFADLCYAFQLHSTVAIRIHPKETAQTLHRDDNVFPLRHPGPPASINAIWAIEDFTADNGGTRVVPGSHRWDDERKPLEGEAIAVQMPAGSVLLFDTALYHGGGANRSDTTRTAVLFSYSLGWLRQLENQYLAVPPELARNLPTSLRELVGYRTHGFLGSFECQGPEAALAQEVPDVLPARDLYTAELEGRRLVRR